MLPAASLSDDALVLLVDSARALSEAEDLLRRARDESSILAVAFDAEWGPTEEEEEGGGEGEASSSRPSDDDGGGARDGSGARRRTSLPTFASNAEAATLFQVALRLREPLETTETTTTTLVFLFDLLRCDHDSLAPTLRSLLSSGDGDDERRRPLRLGWGLRGDLAALHAAGEKRRFLEERGKKRESGADGGRSPSSAAAPPLSAAARVARPAVDLRGVVLSILQREKASPSAPSARVERHGFGLAAAVAAFLGRRLDKEHQRSPWGRRPLSEEQLRYSALDAAVLLELAEAAAARARTVGVVDDDDGDGSESDGDDGCELTRLYSSLSRGWSRAVAFDGSLCGVRGGSRGRRSRNGGSRKGRKKEEEELFRKTISSSVRLVPPWGESKPEEARFLVDNNEGLARQLRLWGVDAQSAPPPSSPGAGGGGGGRVARSAERAAALVSAAVEERRMILTTSRALFSLSLSASACRSARSPPSTSTTAATTTTAVSFVHLLCSSSAPPPATQKKKKNGRRENSDSVAGVPRARDLAADVLRAFNIRPSSSAGPPSSSSPAAALLSRCSACNGDFLPRPFARGDLPEIAIRALGRSSAPVASARASDDGDDAAARPPSSSSSTSPLPFPEDKELWVCSRCGKVYWHGGMYARAIERLTKRLERGLLD